MADVVLFGPFGMLVAVRMRGPDLVRLGLFMLGLGTTVYNLHNFLEEKARADAET